MPFGALELSENELKIKQELVEWTYKENINIENIPFLQNNLLTLVN